MNVYLMLAFEYRKIHFRNLLYVYNIVSVLFIGNIPYLDHLYYKVIHTITSIYPQFYALIKKLPGITV